MLVHNNITWQNVRRNMLEGSAAEAFSREEVREPEAVPNPTRWPIAWILLKPLQTQNKTMQSRHEGLLAVPLRIDVGMPDYLTGRKEFEQSLELRWEVGHRFQMFFASKSRQKGRPGDLTKPQVKPWLLCKRANVIAMHTCHICDKMGMPVQSLALLYALQRYRYSFSLSWEH